MVRLFAENQAPATTKRLIHYKTIGLTSIPKQSQQITLLLALRNYRLQKVLLMTFATSTRAVKYFDTQKI